MKRPTVTCLCVTRKRPKLLNRAIRCFVAQTYGPRELLVIYEDDDPETRSIAATTNEMNIRFLEVPSNPKLPLGALRNIAIMNSNTDFICQWDDDDWYHARRLEMQISSVLNSQKDCCIMAYWLMQDVVTNNTFMGRLRMWEGSVLCRASILKEGILYPELSRGEDTAVIDRLVSMNEVYPLIMPQLYVYVYHENNTWGSNHFNQIYSVSQKLSQETGLILKDILEEKVSVGEGSALLDSRKVLSELRYDKLTHFNDPQSP